MKALKGIMIFILVFAVVFGMTTIMLIVDNLDSLILKFIIESENDGAVY